jgi:hypothetical protein
MLRALIAEPGANHETFRRILHCQHPQRERARRPRARGRAFRHRCEEQGHKAHRPAARGNDEMLDDLWGAVFERITTVQSSDIVSDSRSSANRRISRENLQVALAPLHKQHGRHSFAGSVDGACHRFAFWP